MPANIRVEVAYALPEKQYLQRVTLDEGATVEQAIIASGLLALRAKFPRLGGADRSAPEALQFFALEQPLVGWMLP